MDRQVWELEAALLEGDVFELEVTEQLQRLRYEELLRGVGAAKLEQIGELMQELMRVHYTLLKREGA